MCNTIMMAQSCAGVVAYVLVESAEYPSFLQSVDNVRFLQSDGVHGFLSFHILQQFFIFFLSVPKSKMQNCEK